MIRSRFLVTPKILCHDAKLLKREAQSGCCAEDERRSILQFVAGGAHLLERRQYRAQEKLASADAAAANSEILLVVRNQAITGHLEVRDHEREFRAFFLRLVSEVCRRFLQGAVAGHLAASLERHFPRARKSVGLEFCELLL